LILVCGAIAAVASYRDARRTEEERAEGEFQHQAKMHHTLMHEVLDRYTESLFGLSALFTLDGNVTRTEFQRATTRLKERLSGVMVFEWVPFVTQERRSVVEAAMQKLYPRRAFQIVQFDSPATPTRAGERPYYYPICYIEPMRGNEMALGYDLATGPTHTFLDQARSSRQMVVTHQFRLIQEKEDKPGIVMAWPVYRPAPTNSGTAAPPGADTFLGFLECVFHIDELLETASATEGGRTLDLLFLDPTDPDASRRTLYYRPAADDAPRTPAPTPAEFQQATPFAANLSLSIGEREWRVLYRPRVEWLRQQRTAAPTLRAASVLGLSFLLAGLISVIGRRTDTIRQEVGLRTAELAESRRQFANLLHALPGMAFQARWAELFEVVFASEGALALTGWSAKEFETGAVRIRDLIPAEDIERLTGPVRKALETQQDFEFEHRIVTRTGEEKWVLSRGRGVYQADGALNVLEGLLIDITAAKRMEASRLQIERKLLETQKLESLGLLAGGIAHDFNNLLSTVLGNANLARMSLEAGSPADPQLRAIETAALRAAELCRQMLAYAGKGRFVVERVNLSAMVEELLPLLRVSIARSATLHLQLLNDVPDIKVDATQLRQIVMNLVLNAVDALAGKNGEITLRTGMVSVDASLLARCVTGASLPGGDYVFLDVTDTGAGMTPEVKSKIFEPFFTTKFAGRGLGLAAVLGIVRGHNGALLVDSEVGQGTTFRLFLPPIYGETPIEPATPTVTVDAWRSSGDVLIVEDEEPVREMVTRMVRTFGFAPHPVGDGASGVATFRANSKRWELAVVDLVMPGMDGEQTLRELRAIQEDVRVLLISGYAEGDVLRRVQGHGRVVFLAKPFKREAFEAKLRELFA
jgi:two-component system, cell cycle sensor histidine kinase and response regulator CckA